jgi:folate-dependent phosphoribosylglycinamide formyltransferase PurN
MRIVLWIGDEGNQKALANKIHAFMPLEGLVLEKRHFKRKFTIKGIVFGLFDRLALFSIRNAWVILQNKYDNKYPAYPEVKTLSVENINASSVFDFTKSIGPDLVIVSGTRLIKEKLLSLQPKIGIINLHTGLSPYIKGGPNCTNWCIATGHFHLIGNTVMWIDKGIDTGNILASECTTFSDEKSLPNIHYTVMEHAHQLVLDSVKFLGTGKHQSIPQSSIGKGKTYYTKQWDLKRKIALLRNLSKFISSIAREQKLNRSSDIKQVKLDVE